MTNPDERGNLPVPRTEEGKEVARWNATRHDINSPAPVIPGLEKAEDWEEHRSGVLDSLTPKGHLECVLTERVALLFWRLHRVTRYETESISLAREKMAEDLARARRFDSDFGPGDPEVAQASLKRAQAYYRLLKRFPKLNDDKKLSASDAQNILWDVAEHTDAASEGEVEVEDLLENLSLPGLPGVFPLGRRTTTGVSGWSGRGSRLSPHRPIEMVLRPCWRLLRKTPSGRRRQRSKKPIRQSGISKG